MDENRTKQIEELKLVIDLYTNNVTNFNTYDLASFLVDQKFIPLRHAILQEEKIREEARKETAKEIAEKLRNKYGKSCSEYYPELIELTSIELNELLKEYEVEE